ncbi:ABC transporter substrate-binding protein [Oceanirhabdus sp. W0125-5]|uniref:ABC transporter substrate-binding protein n=1 Tax=Oceanirhabdus sp. W0125-5 TaxID=2999116 RepID=UPI0022F2BAEC|nr:PhnD/SsuA/transferrin family substrate-binding protein [Oceanirhabdus sp. W0125-5]WBW98302.1 PhnD/SsuA/transferrin family substrate-binding protein [Oceanirhabdus sp. W0125-5]
MKKICLVLFTIFISLNLIACGTKNNPKEPVSVSIASLKGPTSIGMIKLIDDDTSITSDNVSVSIEVIPSPDLLVPRLLNEELDIAAVPVNVASKVYNATKGKYEVAVINTLGVLYIVSNDESLDSIEDLKGQTIYCGTPGATPDFILQNLMNKNGLIPDENIIIDYSLKNSELAQAVISGDVQYAILPEPFATMVSLKNKNIKRSINIQDEWNKVEKSAEIIMGALVIKKEFREKNSEFINKFLDEYENSVSWVNDNPVDGGKLLEKHEILPNSKIAELSIPNCNVVYIDAQSKQDEIINFLKILYDFDKKSVGGNLPDEKFFMEK